MLIKCPECKTEVSSQATSCPKCGHPLAVQETPQTKVRRTPIFVTLAAIALLLSLSTPRFLLFFPLMGVLGFSIVSLLRREKGSVVALLVLILGVGVYVLSESSTTLTATSLGQSTQMQDLKTAEIVDWNWSSDPDFGSNGAIKWNVQVRNKSAKPMSLVKVEFTTYDKAGKLIASDFTYVQAIPAGQTRSDESYADYYGTEDKAGVQVADVTFAH